MALSFENSFEVPLPLGDAWHVLLDVPRMAKCLPGAELTETVDARTYKGKVNVKVGPVALTFAGVATFDEILFQDSFGWIVRFVRQHRCVPDEKRRLATGRDEVVDRLHRLASDDQAVIAVSAFGCHSFRESTVGKVPFPELARLKTAISSILQQSRDGRRVPQKWQHLRPIDVTWWIVTADFVLAGIKSR